MISQDTNGYKISRDLKEIIREELYYKENLFYSDAQM